MSSNEFLADLVMLAHALYSLFVIVGLGLTLAGMILRWRWTRHRWFRHAHFTATMLVVIRVWLGLPCPFSVGENELRRETDSSCLLGRSAHDALHRFALRSADTKA